MASILLHPGQQPGSTRTLCHSNDPKKRRGYASISLLRGADERTFAYAVVEPAHRNRKTTELDEVFAADEHIKYESSFSHRFIKDPLEDSRDGGAQVPFYGRYASFPFGKFRHGLSRSTTHADYCLVAQNSAGSPAGFIAYSLTLGNPGVQPLPGHLAFEVTVQDLYTRKRYRGKGAATALIRHLCDSVEIELRHLIGQLPEEPLTNVSISLAAPGTSTSATGHMAYLLALDGVVARLDGIHKDYPGLAVGLVAPPGKGTEALQKTDALQTHAAAA
jgi:GNAT superfamily N-acetyltransferase